MGDEPDRCHSSNNSLKSEALTKQFVSDVTLSGDTPNPSLAENDLRHVGGGRHLDRLLGCPFHH